MAAPILTMDNSADIKSVADTAIWVATYRALESERPDALFRDPLAAVLAGDRGRRIAATMPYPKIMEWVLVIRTLAIDQLIRRAISLGTDTIVNLGAGLDTRPYRMTLPADLRWIEIDFPHMMEFKNGKLQKETPVCRLERIAADLADAPLRRKLFQQIGDTSKQALILTEGVIPYLSNSAAEALSTDLFAVPVFQHWIQDYRQGGVNRFVPRRMREFLKDAPFLFEATDWLSFFKHQGWVIEENIIAADFAEQVHRPFPLVFPWSLILLVLPPRIQKRMRNASGYVMYGRPAPR